MLSSPRTLRALGRCASLAVALLWVGCEQPNDVVATVSALGDAALSTEPDAGAPAASCETSQIYVLLSSIVRNGCRVPNSPSTHVALAAFFAQNPPGNLPGEERPLSACDLIDGRFWFYEPADGTDQGMLCGGHCEVARQYVAAEDQRVLACQGF